MAGSRMGIGFQAFRRVREMGIMCAKLVRGGGSPPGGTRFAFVDRN